MLKYNQKVAEGGFRHAFIATLNDKSVHSKCVIKETKEEVISQVTHTFNITRAEHKCKQIQLTAAARSIAMSFRKKVPGNFGECCKKVFFPGSGTSATMAIYLKPYKKITGLLFPRLHALCTIHLKLHKIKS